MSNKYSIIKLVEKGQNTTNYFSSNSFRIEWRETRHTMEYVKCSGKTPTKLELLGSMEKVKAQH